MRKKKAFMLQLIKYRKKNYSILRFRISFALAVCSFHRLADYLYENPLIDGEIEMVHEKMFYKQSRCSLCGFSFVHRFTPF